MLDTLMWLLNFPASHGYQMVFVAGFSLFGLIAMAVRRPAGRDALAVIRAREGLAVADTGEAARRIRGRLRQWFFRILLLVMLTGGAVGILSLVGVPVTNAYIHANGVAAEATVDGDWVTFTAEDGKTYTLENPFFTPAAYPDSRAWVGSGDPVVVHYLREHPQAFVIATDASGIS
ncbi:hypothetical protein [Microbacterium resistens]|uniref:hypothetical protein n=1 Tax=Microbacterium resistens TaxID=156977 RepID=UPI00366B09B3